MKSKSSKQPDKNRYQIERIRKGLYRVTDTQTGQSATTPDPSPFRPSTQVKLKAIPNKEIDLDRLAQALMLVLRDIDREKEEKQDPPKAA